MGAIRALLQTLTALLRGPDVSHVAVAFDALAPPRTSDGSPGALIRAQYLLGLDAVRALGIVVWPLVRFQADDALASGALRFRDAPEVEQVVICTTDKDLAQCVVGQRVVVLDRIRKRVLDEQGVEEKFGVPPSLIPEYLGLVGDVADGLQGVPGWGAKSAAAVLRRYGSIEAIPDDDADWEVEVRGAAKLAANLRERRREAELYRNLCVLRTDVPLPHSLEDLAWRGANREALDRVARAIADDSVVARVPGWRV